MTQAKPGIWERYRGLIEEYGMIAILTGLGLFLIEMIVLVSLLSAGLDLTPLVDWVRTTLGWDVSGVLEAAGHVGIAYAITRVLKPFQIVLALALTPGVAAVWHRIQRMRGIEPVTAKLGSATEAAGDAEAEAVTVSSEAVTVSPETATTPSKTVL